MKRYVEEINYMKSMLKKGKGKLLSIIVLCLCLCLSACSMNSSSTQYQNTGFAMGTVISQNIYSSDGEEIAAQVLDVIDELEKTISWRIEGSDVANINEAAGSGKAVEVSEKTGLWLAECMDVYEKSGGKLDITVGAAARLWDIGGENPRIPEAEELAEALATVGCDKLVLEGTNVLYEQSGGQLDLGAVGKGIACDEIAEFLTGFGAENDIDINGTFSVGGSVLIYGSKPNGASWKIGIRDPRGEDGDYMGSLTFSQKEGESIFVSTSGDYEKYFEEDGVRYHHILDPETGAPAQSDLISVTVVSETGFLSDALSTACFVAGKEKAMELAEIFDVELVLIGKDGGVFLTEGAEEYFDLLSEEYSLENEEK